MLFISVQRYALPMAKKNEYKPEPMEPHQRNVLLVGFGVYIILVIAIIASYLAVDDEDTRMNCMYAFSTLLVLFTIILALYVYKAPSTARYRQKYGNELTKEDEEEWNKRPPQNPRKKR
jgi:hypothetical protein